MSWLISFMLAGMMVTSQSGLPAYYSDNSFNPNVPQLVVVAPQVVLLDETERFEQTYPLNANGRVSVSNVNGSITVESWDKNEVKLEAVKTADTKENLGNVRIQIDARPDYLKVQTDYDSWRNQSGGTWKSNKLEVQYRLWVPRTAILDEVETVNGSINVSNMNNRTKISTVNGEIKAVNLRGTANISTVNGTVNADFESLQNVSEISLEAVNGTTNLVIPSDAEATIKAETVNGSISNDFGLPIRKGKYVGRDMYGRIGSGAVRINLETVNGAMSVRRRQDGKNVNPATNLLPAKSDDDDDTSMVSAPSSRSTAAVRNARAARSLDALRINAEVARAMKESQKELVKAQKESQKELANAQKDLKKELAELPEIQAITVDAIAQSMAAINGMVVANAQVKIDEASRRKFEALRNRRLFMRDSALPVVERKSETFTVRGTPRVTIDAKNCRVSVRGWDKPEVQYSIIKLARGGQQTPLQHKANQKDSEVNIQVSELENQVNEASSDANQVRVEVFVPKKSNLRILTNREIRVEGISGEVDLRGGNESVNVRDVAGKLQVTSDDGAIRIIGFAGELISKTIEGTTSLEGNFQKLTASADSGMIILTLPDGADATLLSDSEIKSQGFSLIRDENQESLWRIGKGGGKSYNLHSDGQIIVRNASELIAAY